MPANPLALIFIWRRKLQRLSFVILAEMANGRVTHNATEQLCTWQQSARAYGQQVNVRFDRVSKSGNRVQQLFQIQ